jgi:hypothetical protein
MTIQGAEFTEFVEFEGGEFEGGEFEGGEYEGGSEFEGEVPSLSCASVMLPELRRKGRAAVRACRS